MYMAPCCFFGVLFMNEFLKVGVITTTHGLKGEVKVFPTTDLERFDYLEYVLLDTGKEKRRLTVNKVRYVKNLVILGFEEISDINDIERYKGHDLWIAREDAQKLEEGEYYIGDLIDMEVFLDDGSRFGVLKDVLETGANDVYVIDTPDKGEVLIPAIPDCILDVDLENSVMKIHLLKGLV